MSLKIQAAPRIENILRDHAISALELARSRPGVGDYGRTDNLSLAIFNNSLNKFASEAIALAVQLVELANPGALPAIPESYGSGQTTRKVDHDDRFTDNRHSGKASRFSCPEGEGRC